MFGDLTLRKMRLITPLVFGLLLAGDFLQLSAALLGQFIEPLSSDGPECA